MSDGPTALGAPEPKRRTAANLFDDPAVADIEWTAADLESMWRHQLATTLHDNISFGDALLVEPTQIVSLQAMKDFAKQSLSSADQSLPKSIAWMLYIAAVAPAIKRYGQRITSADDSTLREWLQW